MECNKKSVLITVKERSGSMGPALSIIVILFSGLSLISFFGLDKQ